jgi:hypothetical protein
MLMGTIDMWNIFTFFLCLNFFQCVGSVIGNKGMIWHLMIVEKYNNNLSWFMKSRKPLKITFLKINVLKLSTDFRLMAKFKWLYV